jgi:hypothetical protein
VRVADSAALACSGEPAATQTSPFTLPGPRRGSGSLMRGLRPSLSAAPVRNLST